MSMSHLSPKLLTTHVIALIVWMEKAQTFFGMLGALIGFISAVMLVCINWEKFCASKPVRRVRAYFRK